MEASSSTHRSGTPLRALIIGIDKYQSVDIKDLAGAVADATAFKDYLEEDLSVPQIQIDFLANEHATRNNIIAGLQKLAKKDNGIEKNDPILIYYAGHGAQVDTPTKDSRKMEVLVCHDFTDEVQKSSDPSASDLQGIRGGFAESGFASRSGQESVPGIPDLEMAVWINRIAAAKGDNITIVLDCCHSASLTRGSDGTRARTIERKANFELHNRICDSLNPEEVSNLVVATRATHHPTGFSLVGSRSHMLLAACKSTEFALESDGRGHFSTEFLKLLRKKHPDKLQYRDVVPNLTIKGRQNPQCLGDNRDRFIFDGKVVPRSIKAVFKIEPTPGSLTSFTLRDADGIEGILSIGDRFAIYASEDSEYATRLTVLVVQGLKPCILTFPFGKSPISLPSAVATQIGTKLKLYIHSPTEWLLSLVQDFDDVAVVQDAAKADVSVQLDNKQLTFHVVRRIPAAVDSDFNLPSHRITIMNPKDIVHLLENIAFFFWQFDRTSQNRSVSDSVDVHYYKLEEVDGALETIYEYPDAKKQIALVVDGDEVPYGLKLENKSKTQDFYPFIYYFDLSDLSIVKYYESEFAEHDVECPLPKGQSLQVGYGTGGAPPFTYFIPEGKDIDFGIMKIFLFSKPVNLGEIERPSPFDLGGERGSRRHEGLKTIGRGVIDIPIIQRKSASK